MKCYLFLFISLILANHVFARNIELWSTQSTLVSMENTVNPNEENTLSTTENIFTTTTTEPECPENMMNFPWRLMAITLECYCEFPFLPLPVNNTCFKLFLQGPCESGNFLVQPLRDDEGNLPMPRCAVNSCVEDGLIPYNGTCHDIINQQICKNGHLYFSEPTDDVVCQLRKRHQTLVDAPLRPKCPEGSREDKYGICRRKL